MANGQHGGYRRPENPAPVSGPGKHSRRTDGQPGMTNTQAARYISGQDYGEGKVANEVAQAAPLAAAPEIPSLTPIPEGFMDFEQDTQRPEEPDTAGMDWGEGRGYEPIQFEQDPEEYVGQDPVAAIIRAAYASFPTPRLRQMVQQLEAEGR